MLIKRKGICREVSERDFPKFHSLGFVVVKPTEKNEEKPLGLDDLTQKQLQELCDEQGIEYAKRWGKDKLKELLQ